MIQQHTTIESRDFMVQTTLPRQISNFVFVGIFTALVTAHMSLAAGTGYGSYSRSTSRPASQSTFVDAQIAKASNSIDARQYLTAIRILRSVVQVDTRNAEAYNLLGFASRKIKNYKNAERFFAHALKIDANHLGALAYQGELFLILDQPDKANANLDLLQKICGATCEEYLNLEQDVAAFNVVVPNLSAGHFLTPPDPNQSAGRFLTPPD